MVVMWATLYTNLDSWSFRVWVLFFLVGRRVYLFFCFVVVICLLVLNGTDQGLNPQPTSFSPQVPQRKKLPWFAYCFQIKATFLSSPWHCTFYGSCVLIRKKWLSWVSQLRSWFIPWFFEVLCCCALQNSHWGFWHPKCILAPAFWCCNIP